MITPPSTRCSGRLRRNRRPSSLQKEKKNKLTKRRCLRHVKDAEANDMIHMGSDHRCVMATFMITMLGKNIHAKNEKKSKTRLGLMNASSKNISIEMLELEKRFHEIVDTTRKKPLPQWNWAHDTRKNAKAQVKRENAAAAEANRTLWGSRSTKDRKKRHETQQHSSKPTGHTKSTQEMVAAAAATCWQVSDCRNNAPQGDEHPEHNSEEHLGAQVPHQDEGAGSIVFHCSSNTSEIKKDLKSWDSSRRGEAHPKNRNNDWKNWASAKKCIREKRMKRQHDIQRILEDFQGVRNILGIKSATKKVLIAKMKSNHISKRNCRCLWWILQKTVQGQWERWFRTWIGWWWQLQQHRRAQQQYRRDGRNARYHDRRVANRNQQTQIRAEDGKACDEETREMVRQIFNVIIERNEFTLEDWKKVTIKVIHKIETWKMWVTTAQFATNCSRQFCSEGETQCLTRNKQKIRLASENPTRQQQTTLQHTDWLNKIPRVGNQNVDSDSWLHEGVRLHLSQINLGRPQSCNIDYDCISLLEKIYRDQKASVQTDQESNIFDIRKGTKQGDPLSSLLFNTVLQYSLKDEIWRWQKKKEWVQTWPTTITTASRTWDLVVWIQESNWKVGLRIHPDKTKILSNQSTINSDTKKQLEVDDMKIETLTRNESVKYLGKKISFYQQETTEIRIREGCINIPQIQTRVDIDKPHARLFDAAISPTICFAAGTWAPNKEHERMIQSTQRKMLPLIKQTKRKYKKIVKQDIGPKDVNEEVDISLICVALKTVRAQRLRMTWKVKFHLKTMPTMRLIPLIEEEDWIEYIYRSTEDVMEKMECAKIRCWNRTHKKMKWNLALRIATSPRERWLKKAAEWNPELSSRYRTNRAIGRPRKRWEDDINEFQTQEFEEIENPIESSNKTNKTWINIAKDLRRWALLEETTMTV